MTAAFEALEDVPGFDERHSVRPGLTGIAQIYAPRDIMRRNKFRYDRIYIRQPSFWLDVRLIALSFWITFRGRWEHRGREGLTVAVTAGARRRSGMIELRRLGLRASTSTTHAGCHHRRGRPRWSAHRHAAGPAGLRRRALRRTRVGGRARALHRRARRGSVRRVRPPPRRRPEHAGLRAVLLANGPHRRVHARRRSKPSSSIAVSSTFDCSSGLARRAPPRSWASA